MRVFSKKTTMAISSLNWVWISGRYSMRKRLENLLDPNTRAEMWFEIQNVQIWKLNQIINGLKPSITVMYRLILDSPLLVVLWFAWLYNFDTGYWKYHKDSLMDWVCFAYFRRQLCCQGHAWFGSVQAVDDVWVWDDERPSPSKTHQVRIAFAK